MLVYINGSLVGERNSDEKSLRGGRKDLEDIQRECIYNCFTCKQRDKAA